MKKLIFTLLPFMAFSQVGINTTEPKFTLQVNGTIGVTDLPIVETAEYLVVWIPNADPQKSGQFGRIKLTSILQGQSDCPEFVKAESNPYSVKFRSVKSMVLPSGNILINGLSFTPSGQWVENGTHYYSWSNTSGQPLDITNFTVNFGSQTCKYQQ